MTTADKRYPAFTDTDAMPFGKHRGEPLLDVPARYLAWLWGDGLNEYSKNANDLLTGRLLEKRKLANYIWNSKAAIEQEIGESL